MCLCFFFAKRNSYSQVLESDSLALVALYNSTNGSGWSIQWDLSTEISTSWYGVTITNGRVTELNLTNNSLTGTIPTEIETSLN